MRLLLGISLLFLLGSCWPTSVSFVDKGGMPDCWKTFYLTTLDNNAANTPLSYSATISESIKDGIQNNTRLLLNNDSNKAEVNITGSITNYSISPVALQEGDNAAKNRLSVTARFEIFIKCPNEEEEVMNLTSTRFVDYDANTDLGVVESDLLEEVNDQIVQDIINKLLSNW